MVKELQKLKTRQLDKLLDGYRDEAHGKPPRKGWIREIRTALGMSARQLAARMGLSQPGVTQLEASEAAGTITLNSLRKVADALDCELIYAIVPRQSLESMIADRVAKLARDRVARVANTMRLEDQALSAERLREQVNDLVRKMLDDPPRSLWDK